MGRTRVLCERRLDFLRGLSNWPHNKNGWPRRVEEVEAAALAAQCHDFISQLPQGYDTLYGTGIHLSGGEQQRIQLARAILKDAPLLVLDEATSFNAPQNEFLIQQAINRLVENKTVVIIAHRLNTIVHANQILVFDAGRIVARGTQEELLASSPIYTRMWQAHTRTADFTIR